MALKGSRGFFEDSSHDILQQSLLNLFMHLGDSTDVSTPLAFQCTVLVVSRLSQRCHSKISLADDRTFYCQSA